MIGRRKVLGGAGVALAFSHVARADSDGGVGSPASLNELGADPQNVSTPKRLFTTPVIATSSFFVRSHFGPPALDRARVLSVDGLLKTPLTLKPADLKGLPEVTLTAVLQCSGNGRSFHSPRVPGLQWDHGAMGQATFTGVRLRDLLEKAGLDVALRKGTHVHLRGADGPPKPTVPAFVRSIPIERALDPSVIVAYGMNGEPLTLQHGAPLRLVVPGWAGDHWVKWLTRITVAKDEAPGFYMQTAYKMPIDAVAPGAAVPPEKMRTATTFPVKSVIGRAERNEVVGVAFSGEAAVARVEVSLDAGATWLPAKLEGEGGPGRWQVFRFTVERAAGDVKAVVRATDAKGNVQPEKAAWNPSGYFWNGWDSAEWSTQ